MKTNITGLGWVFFSWLVLLSCKKEKSENHQITTLTEATTIKKLKNFYEEKLKQHAGEVFTPSQGEPQWNKIKFSAATNNYLVPVDIGIRKDKNKFIVNKFIHLRELHGQLSGEYYYIISEKGKPAADIEQVMNKISFAEADKEIIGTRLSSVIKSSLVPGGQKTGNSINPRVKSVSSKKAGAVSAPPDPENLLPAACDGGTIVRIDWYYQEYDSYGNVVYEQFVFSTWECFEGGGGGSTGTGTTSTCTQLSGFLNSGQTYSINVSRELISQSQVMVSYKYRWLIFIVPPNPGVTPGSFTFHSEEIGTHIFQNNKWKWLSLVHERVVKDGFSMGISLNCTGSNGTPNIGTGAFADWASMNLSFTIEAAAICQGFPLAHSITRAASKSWNINYIPS